MTILKNSGALNSRKSSDEMYTRYAEIESEMSAMLEDYPDLFRGKSVLLPCNDLDSGFYRYFKDNFGSIGCARVSAVGYSEGGQGLVKVLDSDGENVRALAGSSGDFRSDAVTALRDECDIIITNPPFSKMREFGEWVMGSGKLFSFVIKLSHLSYYELFRPVMGGAAWTGHRPAHLDMRFDTCDGKEKRIGGVCWLTNMPAAAAGAKVELHTMSENIEGNELFQRLSTERYGKPVYMTYDNYPALEVPCVSAIPSDYDGAMGVPISYLGKHDPDKFEILGLWKGNVKENTLDCFVRGDAVPRPRTRPDGVAYTVNYTGPVVSGREVFVRVLIRRKDSNG